MKFYTKNKQVILSFLFIIVLALLFNKYLANILLEIGILINYHSTSFFIAYIIILTLIISGYLYVFFKPYVLNKKVTLFVGISVSIYMILLFTDNNLHFETLNNSNNKFLRYANIIFLVGLIQVIYLIVKLNLKLSRPEYINFNKDIEDFKGSSFIEDGLFVEGEIDNELILNRLLGMLSNFKPNSSFCVGLNAVWGHGKSSFLKRFEFKYRATSNKDIIFWYNIWKNRESTAIIENFFDELKNNLTPHSGELSNSIDCYVEAILALSSSQTQTIINAGNKLFSQDKTLETYYNEINESIKKIDKQVVIILDDLDRLEKDEILSSLKLIRTLSDFNNVIFIAGYDRSYITKKLGPDYKGYIDKIFNVEINFLPSAQNLLSQFLINEIEKIENNPNRNEVDKTLSESFKNLFSNYNDLSYSDFFSTYRGVKRFINEFKFNLTFLENINDIQLDQYILLKLCTYKFRFTQNLIFNDLDKLLTLKAVDKVNEKLQFASFENQNIYVFDKEAKEKINQLLEKNKIDPEDVIIINAVLVFLFSERNDIQYYADRNTAISKIYYTELYVKNDIATGKYKVSQFQELFELNKLHSIGSEIEDLPSQLKGQIKNEIMNFIFSKVKIDSVDRFIDVLKTINFSMISYSISEDNKILSLIDEKSNEFFNSDEKFIESFEAILVEAKIGYLANLISEVNINEKRTINGTYSASSIANYSSSTFNDKTIKRVSLKILNELIDKSANVDIILNAYHLYTQAIVQDKKIFRSFEANELVKKDIGNRFKDYKDTGLLDYSHDGPTVGFEDIKNYYPPHFFIQVFSTKEAYEALFKGPQDESAFDLYLNMGCVSYATFLRDYLRNNTVSNEIELKVNKMLELLEYSMTHTGVELSHDIYIQIVDS